MMDSRYPLGYEPDEEPQDERDPVICAECGEVIPDGKPIIHRHRPHCEWCSDVS